jgi:hypothetical protein
MAEQITNARTTLGAEDVVVRAVQFFTTESWRMRTQSTRIVTFAGKGKIPCGLLILTIIAFFFFVIPGLLLYILVIRKTYSYQNLVVTTTPVAGGSEVVITHPASAQAMVQRFIAALPPLS